MKFIKALIGAVLTTTVSCLLLTFTQGIPTKDMLLRGGGQMFAVAFIVLLVVFYSQKKS